jgi:S1-C subfamily serine protease
MFRPCSLAIFICALAFAFGLTTVNAPEADAQTFEEGPTYSDYLKDVGVGALDQVVAIDTRFTRRMWDVNRYRTVTIASTFGSGFVYDDEGHIVCDYSIVLHYPSSFVSTFKPHKEEPRAAAHIRVTFNDGRAYPAELIGYDTATSLAVIKVNRLDPEYLAPVTFADSNLVKVGEPLAIIAHNRNTQTLTAQVTSGIISALRTQYPALEETENIFFQVNYPYNAGNEGGVLLNVDGEMVAMVTSSAPYDDIQEIHFALPENVIRDVVDQIIGAGEVRRSWFGFNLLDFSDELRRAFEIPDPIEIDYIPSLPEHVLRKVEEGELESGKNDKDEDVIYIFNDQVGMFIIFVEEESPAEAAGLAAHDIFWMFQDKIIENVSVLNNELEKYDIGDIVTITYLRRYYEKYEVFTTEFELTYKES